MWQKSHLGNIHDTRRKSLTYVREWWFKSVTLMIYVTNRQYAFQKTKRGNICRNHCGYGLSNERRRYNETSSLIGWDHIQNNPYIRDRWHTNCDLHLFSFGGSPLPVLPPEQACSLPAWTGSRRAIHPGQLPRRNQFNWSPRNLVPYLVNATDHIDKKSQRNNLYQSTWNHFLHLLDGHWTATGDLIDVDYIFVV